LTFQVTGLLREFTKKCGEEAIQELNTQKRPCEVGKSGAGPCEVGKEYGASACDF